MPVQLARVVTQLPAGSRKTWQQAHRHTERRTRCSRRKPQDVAQHVPAQGRRQAQAQRHRRNRWKKLSQQEQSRKEVLLRLFHLLQIQT